MLMVPPPPVSALDFDRNSVEKTGLELQPIHARRFDFSTQSAPGVIALSSIDNQDSSQTDTLYTTNERKSAAKALFLSTIPGFAVHGLGHKYVGDIKTFRVLFISELVSAPLMLIALPGVVQAEPDTRDNDSRLKTVFNTGATIFLATWAYDIVVSPIKAYINNRQSVRLIVAPSTYEANHIITITIQCSL